MTPKRWLAVGVLAATLGVGGWAGWHALYPGGDSRTAVTAQDLPLAPGGGGSGETIDVGQGVVDSGTTPMAQRVAVVGLLNKRNGESRALTLKPGQAVRVGDAIVRLRACEQTAPWEVEQLTGAFVQLDVRGADRHWRRVFSGWLYKERPAANVVQHPIYDVWTKSCTTSFPDKGPDTQSLSDVAPARSSAKKSPDAAADDAATPDDPVEPTTPSSAAPSNAM